MFEGQKKNYEHKKDFYADLQLMLASLIEDEPNAVANMANASALLFFLLEDINWAGFYLCDENQLVLGPFQGKPACVRIQMGHGACGTAAAQRASCLVKNVHEFPGHIACDSESLSEIVIPIFAGERLYGVLDIDSPVTSRFDEEDKLGLEAFVQILEKYL